MAMKTPTSRSRRAPPRAPRLGVACWPAAASRRRAGVDLRGDLRAARRDQPRQQIAQRLRQADDRRIVEQVEQERPHRVRAVRPAEIEQDDGAPGHDAARPSCAQRRMKSHEPADIVRRRLRQDAVAEIEDERALAQRAEDVGGYPRPWRGRRSSRSSGSRLPCTVAWRCRTDAAQPAARWSRGRSPSTPVSARVVLVVNAGAAGKRDDRHRRMPQPQLGRDLADRRYAPALERGVRQRAGPAVEDLHRLGAGVDLRHQIADRRIDQQVHQLLERVSGRHRPSAGPGRSRGRRRLRPCRSRRSRARRRSRSAPSRAAACARPAAPFPGPVRAAPRPARGSRRAVRSRAGVRTGSSTGPSPSRNSSFWPSACGTSRMSANRIAASMPNRRIGCSVISAARSGVQAERDEIRRLRPQRPVLRQIATGLAHEPERRAGMDLAMQGADQGLGLREDAGRWHGRRSSFPNRP